MPVEAMAAATGTATMEITVSKSELLRELTATQGVVERKTTIPILSNYLFEASNDKLSLNDRETPTAPWAVPVAARVIRDGRMSAVRALITMSTQRGGAATNHGSLEDWDYLEAASPAQREAADKILQIIREYVEAFLSKHLNRENSDLLEPGSGKPGLQWRVYVPAASSNSSPKQP